MIRQTITLLREGYPDRPGFDVALSRALLRAVGRGEQGETVRLHRPGRQVSFGPQDTLAPGFREAVALSRAQRFDPVLRLAGGRAAVFHPETIAFSWTIRDPAPVERIHQRFQEIAEIMAAAL